MFGLALPILYSIFQRRPASFGGVLDDASIHHLNNHYAATSGNGSPKTFGDPRCIKTV
jgi:hypothetical protein